MVYSQTRLDSIFAALADPTRRSILGRLADGERTIGELAGRFDMSLPAVSKHVRVLERAGLTEIRRDGRVRRARLVAAPLGGAMDWLSRYRRFWEFQMDELERFLVHTTADESSECPPPSNPPPASSKSAESSTRRGNVSSRRGPTPRR